jgi:hypothetical protein
MPVFARLFDRDAMLLEARRLGAVKRDRRPHVWDVLLAIVLCAIGDEHRSGATARRQFFDLTGFMPEESSFYDRLTPAFADLAWQQFLRVLASANRVQRRRVAKALGVHVRDVRVVDASVVTLPARAAAHFPPTDSKHGGFKLTARLSVLEDVLVNAHITDARRHDRKAFELPADRRGVLWIADRGYTDHTLFAKIADGHGYFLVRLKTSSLPTITTIRSGVAKANLHEPLTPELPAWGVTGVDARCVTVEDLRYPITDGGTGSPASNRSPAERQLIDKNRGWSTTLHDRITAGTETRVMVWLHERGSARTTPGTRRAFGALAIIGN